MKAPVIVVCDLQYESKTEKDYDTKTFETENAIRKLAIRLTFKNWQGVRCV